MQLVKEIHHDAARLAVQCAGRLVGQDQRRLIDHGAGNRDALLLSAGKLVGLVAHPLAHADALEPFLGAAGALPCRDACIQHRQFDVF